MGGQRICFRPGGSPVVGCKAANRNPWNFGHPGSSLFGRVMMCLSEGDLDCSGGQSRICSHQGCFVEKI